MMIKKTLLAALVLLSSATVVKAQYQEIGDRKHAEYKFTWQREYVKGDACIDETDPAILHLGSDNGYYDLTAKTGALIKNLKDFSVSVRFKVSSENKLDGYGHFLFAFSQLAENSAHEGPYMAMRLNEQRFETSTGGYEHEEIIMQGGKPKRDKWVHVLYRQQGHKGELFLDGELIGRNERMPILAEIFSDAPANCWIGRAPFRGDKYLTQTEVADFRLFNYALSDMEINGFKKFNVMDEFTDNGFRWFNDALLLAAGSKEKSNAMTIGWGSIGTLWGRPALTVYVAEKRYTKEFMDKGDYFTVMAFDVKDSRVLTYMGSKSGRDGDKAQALGLHTAFTANGTPYYTEAAMVLECKMMYEAPFDPKGFKSDVPKRMYSNFPAGIHTMYIGEVVNAWKK